MPARARDLARALRALGLTVEEPSSGSHWHITDGTHTFPHITDGTHTFPLPLHNGLKTEVSDVYIKKLCARFEIEIRVLLDKI